MFQILLSFVLLSLIKADNFAVLVAGSNQYYNYRHQADICHAYQILVQKGMNPNNIVVMAYDDIANNVQNPIKGHLFNKPTYGQPGKDVYNGCKIDYKGEDVTPDNFYNVLNGKKDLLKDKGNGRALESTSNDNVFIFFSDHGAEGLIAFPTQYMFADYLMQALNEMSQRKKFKELVFYLEACESGSMFVDLPNNIKIFATTAANGQESSWATYCGADAVVGKTDLNTCLGDLYSVNWMEDSELSDTTIETIFQQFSTVQKKTDKSHVLKFGDESFTSEPVGDFLGLNQVRQDSNTTSTKYSSVSSRLAKLDYFKNIAMKSNSIQAQIDYQNELAKNNQNDIFFNNLGNKFNLHSQRNGHIDYDCLRQVIASYEEKCGKFDDYSLQFVKFFSNFCRNQNSNLNHSLQIIAMQSHFMESC